MLKSFTAGLDFYKLNACSINIKILEPYIHDPNIHRLGKLNCIHVCRLEVVVDKFSEILFCRKMLLDFNVDFDF